MYAACAFSLDMLKSKHMSIIQTELIKAIQNAPLPVDDQQMEVENEDDQHLLKFLTPNGTLAQRLSQLNLFTWENDDPKKWRFFGAKVDKLVYLY